MRFNNFQTGYQIGDVTQSHVNRLPKRNTFRQIINDNKPIIGAFTFITGIKKLNSNNPNERAEGDVLMGITTSIIVDYFL